jgi:hypothetical protein
VAAPGDADRIGFQPRKLRKLSVRELLIRFAFGAGISFLAGVISTIWGARAGGVFLAFPAILLASLTMIAEEEGLPRSRDDARGAALGTLGLIGFACVAAWAFPRWFPWAALAAATLVWALVGGLAFLFLRLSGRGGDER